MGKEPGRKESSTRDKGIKKYTDREGGGGTMGRLEVTLDSLAIEPCIPCSHFPFTLGDII